MGEQGGDPKESVAALVSLSLGDSLAQGIGPRSHKAAFRGELHTQQKRSRNIHRDPTEFLLNTKTCLHNIKLQEADQRGNRKLNGFQTHKSLLRIVQAFTSQSGEPLLNIS